MMIRSIAAEFGKLKRSRPVMWTFVSILAFGAISFGIAPQITKNNADALVQAGGVWKRAVEAGIYAHTWKASLHQLPMAMDSGLALLLFAFVAAYVFGHEFKEHTMVSTFTTPLRREYVIASKFVVLAAWIAALTVFLFLLYVVEVVLLGGGSGFAWSLLFKALGDALLVSFILFLIMPVFAWLAVWGGGYLRPMLAAVVLLGIGNGLIGTSLSPYYPINIPIHIYGTSWMPIPPSSVVPASWVVLAAVFLLGLAGTMRQVDRADIRR